MIHFTVSDDPIEPLDQLNTLITEFVFHFDRLDENKILLIKLNLSKWKSAGYSVRLEGNTENIPDDHNHRITLYKTYSIIG